MLNDNNNNNNNSNNNNDTLMTWECTDETWTWQYFPINTSLTAISGFICCLTFNTKILQSILKHLIQAIKCFISKWVKLLIWTYMLSKHISYLQNFSWHNFLVKVSVWKVRSHLGVDLDETRLCQLSIRTILLETLVPDIDFDFDIHVELILIFTLILALILVLDFG